MRFIRRGLLNNSYQPTVATIGAYDGIHLGHQQVLQSLCQKAKSLGFVSTVICFEPLPKEFFLKNNPPARVILFRDKYTLLKALKIDQLVCIPFDETFSQMEAKKFVKDVLVNALNIKYLIVGDDFRFGRKRLGNYELLQTMGQELGFSVEETKSFKLNGKRVSSSLIRDYLKEGDFTSVNNMLGRSYAISGRVLHGKKLGRTIGFPTINLAVKHRVALNGIYIVQVIFDKKVYYGVANIGVRPTVCGKKRLLEVYIFNFDQQIYNKHVKVIFLHYLRPELAFKTIAEMTKQIKIDAQNAQAWLKKI